ncbi:MAG: DUF192 domain-containing protein [Candidatus Falkowbacteria bacterium]|nr:DUF192 domain-containing protein [Candidatus Falkowbacteria bacterium]
MIINTRRVIIFGLVIIVLILLGVFELFLVKNLRSAARYLIQINEQAISVELADTNASRYRGLSGRNNLEADYGMLFSFPTKETQSFVMRDMKFPLDIVFIADSQIVEIVAAAQPEGSDPTKIYTSSQPIDYALELTGGYAARNNFKVGDKVYGLSFK